MIQGVTQGVTPWVNPWVVYFILCYTRLYVGLKQGLAAGGEKVEAGLGLVVRICPGKGLISALVVDKC